MRGIKSNPGFNDLKLAGDVRTLGLKQVFKCLKEIDTREEGEDLTDFQAALLLRIAPNLLPRLNEHTGQDGGAIQISGVEITVRD